MSSVHTAALSGFCCLYQSFVLTVQCTLTGLASPRGSMGEEWTALEASPNSLEASTSDPAPTWGKVLGSLKSWGITPAPQSAAAPSMPSATHQEPSAFPSGQRTDSEPQLRELEGRAFSDSEGLRAPLGRRGSLKRVKSRGALADRSDQQQDRLSSSLDGSQVHSWLSSHDLLHDLLNNNTSL